MPILPAKLAPPRAFTQASGQSSQIATEVELSPIYGGRPSLWSADGFAADVKNAGAAGRAQQSGLSADWHPTLTYTGRVSPAPSAASHAALPPPYPSQGSNTHFEALAFGEQGSGPVQRGPCRQKRFMWGAGALSLLLAGAAGVGIFLSNHNRQIAGLGGLPAGAVDVGKYMLAGRNSFASCALLGLDLCSPIISGEWDITRSQDGTLHLQDYELDQNFPLMSHNDDIFHLFVPNLIGGNATGCVLSQDYRARLLFAPTMLNASAVASLTRVDPTCSPTEGMWPIDADRCDCKYEIQGFLNVHQASD